MSLDEVRTLLDKPGEDVLLENVITVNVGGKEVPAIQGDRFKVWPGTDAWIWIGFTNDRVASKYFFVNRL